MLHLGNFRSHEAQLLARDFASGIPRIENIESILARELTVSSVRAVCIAPVADA